MRSKSVFRSIEVIYVKNEYSIVSIVSIVALVGLILTMGIGGEGMCGAHISQTQQAECKMVHALGGYYTYNTAIEAYESCGTLGGFNRGAPREYLEYLEAGN